MDSKVKPSVGGEGKAIEHRDGGGGGGGGSMSRSQERAGAGVAHLLMSVPPPPPQLPLKIDTTAARSGSEPTDLTLHISSSSRRADSISRCYPFLPSHVPTPRR